MANPEALMLWEEMRKDVKNKLCVECGANNPQWASVSYGTIFCLECSGVHRSLGVHISFVRSLTMDQWSQEQLRKMKVGGNRKFAEFFEAHGVPAHYSIKEKYHTEVAQIYKDKISALSSGREWRDPPVGSLSTVPVLPQARVISSSSGPAAGSQDSQSSAPPSSRYGGMGNFTPKPSNNSSSDSEWSALLGSSWGAISAITSTAAAKTQELAQIAAEKIQTGTTDISSKVQTTDWTSVKQNLVSSSQSTWSSFSSFLSSATESLTHLAKEVTLSEEEARKQQGQGQGISASVVPSDTFGDWEIPDDLSPPPPSSLKSSGSSPKAPASPASSLPSSSPASKPDTKTKGAWSKEAYSQGWSSSDADKVSKEKPVKTVTKTSSSESGSKDGWDNWDAGWEDEEDEDDVPKKNASSGVDSSAKASAPVDASGWSDPSWDSNWDNAD